MCIISINVVLCLSKPIKTKLRVDVNFFFESDTANFAIKNIHHTKLYQYKWFVLLQHVAIYKYSAEHIIIDVALLSSYLLYYETRLILDSD